MRKLNVNDVIFYRAYIWDPNKPKKISPCTLSIQNGEPIMVECWKNLKIFKSSFRDLNFHEPIKYLFGNLEDGKLFTIYNIKLESSRTGTGISKIGLIAEVFLKGDHISLDEKIVNSLSIRNQYLEDWADLRTVSVKNKGKDILNLHVNIEVPDEIIFFQSSAIQIVLGHFISYPLQKVKSFTFNPKLYIKVVFGEAVNINEALLIREAFKLFFQLLLNVEAGIEETFLKTNDDSMPNEIFVFENEIKWNYASLSNRNILLDLNIFLSFSDILIPNWLKVFKENKDAIFEYYRISKSRNLVNKREVYMNSMQGLEMFYKIFYINETDEIKSSEFKKEDKLKLKLKTFFNEVPDIIDELIPNPTKFIDQVVGTRNHFAHYNLDSRESDPLIIPKRLLGAYSKRIELVNDLVLLSHLGVPPNLIKERFQNHVHWYIYKDQNYLFV